MEQCPAAALHRSHEFGTPKLFFWVALNSAQVTKGQKLGKLRFPSGGRAAGTGDPGHLSSIRHGNELSLGDSLEPRDGDLLGFGSKAWH